MATVTLDATGPGAGATRPVVAQSPRAVKILTGTFSFDSSYPTGGEPLTGITGEFKECVKILMEQPIIAGAQTGKFLRILKSGSVFNAALYTNASPFAEVANASDQSLITNLQFIAVGY